MKVALYRHFDAAGKLLYVGVSLDTIRRTAQHAHGAQWFHEISSIEISACIHRRLLFPSWTPC